MDGFLTARLSNIDGDHPDYSVTVGTLVLVRRVGAIHRLIRLIMQSHYNHVGVVHSGSTLRDASMMHVNRKGENGSLSLWDAFRKYEAIGLRLLRPQLRARQLTIDEANSWPLPPKLLAGGAKVLAKAAIAKGGEYRTCSSLVTEAYRQNNVYDGGVADLSFSGLETFSATEKYTFDDLKIFSRT